MSFFEVSLSTFIGLFVSFLANCFIFPIMGIPVSLSQNLFLVAFFTIVSIVRSYAVRRLFNWLQFARFKKEADEHTGGHAI